MISRVMSKYIISKIDGKEYCKINGKFSIHLRNHGLTYKEYYETYETGVCLLCDCGKSRTFYQKNNSYAKTCGDVTCVGKEISRVISEWSDDKRKLVNHRKREANKLVDKNKVIEKMFNTYHDKYGTTWANSSEQKNKCRKTKLQKYGNEYYSGWDKSSKKNKNKTVKEKNEINEKRRTTNIELYGVQNTFLIPHSVRKARQSNSLGKEYTMPSGKVIGIRGYEDRVLDILLEVYDENDLMIDNRKSHYSLPTFEYINVNQHKQIYHPDIYIQKENLVIEVKSQWWWDGKGDKKYSSRLENNIRKKDAVLNSGFLYRLYLFGDNDNLEVFTWI